LCIYKIFFKNNNCLNYILVFSSCVRNCYVIILSEKFVSNSYIIFLGIARNSHCLLVLCPQLVAISMLITETVSPIVILLQYQSKRFVRDQCIWSNVNLSLLGNYVPLYPYPFVPRSICLYLSLSLSLSLSHALAPLLHSRHAVCYRKQLSTPKNVLTKKKNNLLNYNSPPVGRGTNDEWADDAYKKSNGNRMHSIGTQSHWTTTMCDINFTAVVVIETTAAARRYWPISSREATAMSRNRRALLNRAQQTRRAVSK
jgi:hypothetical protein